MRLLPPTIAGRVILVAALAVALAVGAALGLGALGPAAVLPAVLGAALSAIGLAWVVARTIADPIGRLAERADLRTVSSAGWSPGPATKEISRLAASLRRLATDAAARYTAAEAERDRFATLLREMADAVVIVREDDVIDLANPAAERILGGGAAMVGRRAAEVVRDHELLEAIDGARREGASATEIERGEPRRSIRATAVRLPGGDTLVSAQDLTTVRRLETVRRDFVANVSHELRTPLASLKAMAEALEAGALDDRGAARDFVARMHREIDELAQLVAELLTLARVESGDEEMRRRAVAPAEIVASAASRLRPLAERAGVALEVGGDGAPAVLADPDRVGQVLSNLVHNAVKFTPAGGRITIAAEPAPGGGARFVVRDTGIGLARDELDRVFERFYKSERSRAGGGTGLGLAIARHIVGAHGGTIAAESEGPGRGAVFSFTLPPARDAR